MNRIPIDEQDDRCDIAMGDCFMKNDGGVIPKYPRYFCNPSNENTKYPGCNSVNKIIL